MYLNKPIFAFPEGGNKEQSINAHYINKSGKGLAMDIKLINRYNLSMFLDSLEQYKRADIKSSLCGNEEVLASIREVL